MARDLLGEDEIERQMAGLGWTRQGDRLEKELTFADFRAAMAFVNRLADLAESRNHHPDIAISWNRVSLRLTTHDRGGLTGLDFDLARAVDALDAG
ncbi:MAG TPA: 4a-hydroxytetrahydrobiopterin dehydratase [Acidimicrobiales bacterium]|nr:4a-hydroxytetrahydrobiopterin dehydratase [Acidimicrobiales bacterium]